MSARGFCPDCARTALVDNIQQLAEGEGPYYDHWRMRHYLASRQRVLDLLTQTV